jgi:methionyl-tRNA formyltransferase
MKVPYYYLKKESNGDLERWVKNLEPDLIVVYSMSRLLNENVFSIPKFGTVNLYNSYLLEYRGQVPIFWIKEKIPGISFTRNGFS